jgi:nucleoside-diphosphate-sugar epimerase
MNVLITGGSGFLGRFFIERLGRMGGGLSVLDLEPLAGLPGGMRFLRGDVRDPTAVRAALQDCDSVLHLAAAHHDFGISPATYASVNEGGARVLCQGMDERGIRKLCFYSSVAVYGATLEPRHEGAPCRPVNAYGESKLAGELVFRDWVAQGDGRSALIVRPTVVFGPHNFANMFALIRQVDTGRYLPVGGGRNIKSLCYVDNIVDATLQLWGTGGRPPFDIYNYVDKPDLTSRQIAAAVHQALGKPPPRLSIPLWAAMFAALPFDLASALTGRDFAVSTARIKKFAHVQSKFEADKVTAAGYRAGVSLVEGITRMVEWYQMEGKSQTPSRHLPPAEVITGYADSWPARV